MIEVRLQAKEKLRRRLGEVSNERFTVKLAKGNKIEDRKIAFDDVNSIKSVGGSKAGRTALYVLVGVGVGLLVVGIVVAVVLHNGL